MSRLAHVLRAGEARRQSRSQSGVVRTGTLAMEDMSDDVLRSILDALASGASNEACAAAKNWCTLNTQHRRACEEGGDGVWQTLTTRIFGLTPAIYAGPGNAQKNFYALCLRDRAQRLLPAQHRRRTDEPFLRLAADILTHLDAGGRNTPAGRVQLVAKVTRLLKHAPEAFDPIPEHEKILELCNAAFLYGMANNGTDEEIDAALDLLGEFAYNWDEDFDYDEEDGEYGDYRYGYNDERVWILDSLFARGSLDRRLKILRIWMGLLDTLGYEDDLEEWERDNAKKDYAHAMIGHGVPDTLVNGIVYGGTTLQSQDEINLRNWCAVTLKRICHASHN